ncbi:glycosyltransferase family 9 protein [Swingsia samuiensis]|uniref:Glycosyltransferase family 9 protein n=1 Tax=Swingsia samuiensis TaxID=1293412 RepID=A0A4Y6UKZ7_9PROT|nr:glycosyltransferase family 9 protein [Swingsia samuiensis]QDH17047.1 glycosyltransferase family 9 protein [Swingsia samuiensis]
MSRILVIKLGALGDFIQSFGAFSSIREAYPHAHITLLTTPAFYDLALASPWFDAIIAQPRPTLKRPVSLFKTCQKIKDFDRVFDLQTSNRSKKIFHIAGRPKHWSGISKGCCHPHANPSRNDMHTLARMDDQLIHAGIIPQNRTVPTWLKDHGPTLQERYAVLIPGAAPHRPQKRWPISRFAEVGNLLSEKKIRPVIVGTKEETPLATYIQHTCPDALDLTGQTSLLELAGVLGRACVVIGNDTGPIHLAAIMDTPIIALFSQDSDPRLTSPLTITPGRTTIIDVPDLALLPTSRIAALLPT